MAEESYDVIVVGAGFGGCSCAALLAKRGLKVLLVEKNPNAGGKGMTLSKGGYTYAAWVVVAAPVLENKFEIVLKELGMEDRVNLVAPGTKSGNIYITASGELSTLPPMPADGETDPNVIFDWLEVKEEERGEALRMFMELTLMPPEEIEELHDTSFKEWINQYDIPPGLYAFLASLCCDLMFVLPVDALAASEAIRSLQDMFLRNGGLFCQGGFGKLAEVYCDGVRENGGKVIMQARTEQIIVEEGLVKGVVTNKGTFHAPIVISNAGIQPTVLKLVGEDHFDKSYTNYVKELVPSVGIMGMRYFLNKELTKEPFGVIFSNESPWSLERFNKAKAGETPKVGVVFYEIPSNYDPDAAPEGKHVFLTSYWCPADPNMSEEEIEKWREAGEALIHKAFPDLQGAIESEEVFTTRDVSNLTRDQVLPGQGGECIGLGQFLGQCGSHKPSTKGPIKGLFYVGCDAGGQGVGTQQAVDSGIKLADKIIQYHHMQTANRID